MNGAGARTSFTIQPLGQKKYRQFETITKEKNAGHQKGTNFLKREKKNDLGKVKKGHGTMAAQLGNCEMGGGGGFL